MASDKEKSGTIWNISEQFGKQMERSGTMWEHIGTIWKQHTQFYIMISK